MNSASQPILCFGEILWDSLPQGLFPGGAPVNVAYHLKQLGLNPVPVTAVGRDFLGEELLRRMKRWGMATECVTSNDRPTGAVLVELNEAGVPKFNILEHVAWDEITLNEAAHALAPKASAVIYGTLAQRCEPNRKQLCEVLEMAGRARSPLRAESGDTKRRAEDCPPYHEVSGALRIFDVNLRPPFDVKVVWELAARAQVIKLNHDELRTLTDGCFAQEDFEKAARAFAERANCGTVCVTAGARGAGLLMDGGWHWVDARPVEVNDTVGSGDAFLASLTWSLLAGKESPSVMLESACRLAEFVATQEGAMPPYRMTADGFEPQMK